MPPSTKPLRRHGAAPANWQHRAGRPAWIPSPTLRKAGWRRHDFKDPRTGAWLSEGASIDEARLLNKAVEAWRAGQLVPAAWAHVAPAGAADTPASPWRPPLERFSIGRLADDWIASEDFRFTASGTPRAEGTRRDYRNKLKRLVDVLAGYTALPADPGDAAYRAALDATRAASIFTLQPVEQDGRILDPLKRAYRKLKAEVGDHQASGVLAVASVWLTWCRQTRSRTIYNWAKDVARAAPAGRIRPLTWPEIYSLVEAFEAMGLPSMADSVILGVDLSWSQVDRLRLTWDRVRDDRAFTGAEGRQKTGRVGGTPFLSIGRRRLIQIRERQLAMAARPTHVLWCELTGAPWKPDHYRHVFAQGRARAALACPSVATARDQDLRDTAFTLFGAAGLDDDMIASRTLQSRRHIKELGDKAYGEIGPEIADRGRDLMDAYLLQAGVKL